MVRQVPVSLHLGAHKTASTHVQRSLVRNEDLLRAHGVRFLGPRYLRRAPHHMYDLFGLRPSGGLRDGLSGAEQVARLADGADRLVLSEENMLGQALTEGNPAMLYPAAGFRVERFVQTVAPCPVTLFLSVREPCRWLASLYAQRVCAGEVREFKDYSAEHPPSAMRWSDLAARLTEVEGIKGLVVWRYEDYPAVSAPVFRRMLGWRVGPLVKRIEKRVHTSLGVAEIDQMRQWSRDGRAGKPKDWLRELNLRDEDADKRQVFDPWTAQDLQASRAEYETDLETLAALDGVRFLTPSAKSRSTLGEW